MESQILEINEDVVVSGAYKTDTPFYKYEAALTTLTINTAATGTGRTVTASSGFFTTDYIGHYLTIDGSQVKITGYTSPTVVTVTQAHQKPSQMLSIAGSRPAIRMPEAMMINKDTSKVMPSWFFDKMLRAVFDMPNSKGNTRNNRSVRKATISVFPSHNTGNAMMMINKFSQLLDRYCHRLSTSFVSTTVSIRKKPQTSQSVKTFKYVGKTPCADAYHSMMIHVAIMIIGNSNLRAQ